MGHPVTWTEEVIDQFADDLSAYFRDNPDRKYLEQFCADYGTYPQKISELCKRSAKLTEAVNLVKAVCAARILTAGESAERPSWFIFAAKNVAGWADKADVNSSVSAQVEVVKSLSQALSAEG